MWFSWMLLASQCVTSCSSSSFYRWGTWAFGSASIFLTVAELVKWWSWGEVAFPISIVYSLLISYRMSLSVICCSITNHPQICGLKRFSCPQFCGFAIWTGLSRGGLALLHVLAGELRAGGTKMALFMCGALVLAASWSASGALQVTFLYLLPLHSVV